MKYTESINDKHILKAIFLAGGPGSGKSYISSEMFSIAKDTISPLGIKTLNVDIPLEKALKKANLSSIINKDNSDLYNKQMEIRSKAKEIIKAEKHNYINSLLSILIDGTGKNYTKITEQANAFKLLGYDVYMVFVNTSLEVALERNRNRERQLDDEMVKIMWENVQRNIGAFQRYFGSKNFFIVDNNDTLEKGSEEEISFKKELNSICLDIINRPIENPIGKGNLTYLRKNGGKYFTNLESHPILNEATKKYVYRSAIKNWKEFNR